MAWDWRRCPHCGATITCKWGSYERRPWTLAGRQTVRVARHFCRSCGRTYAEESLWLVRKSWYGRDVRRGAVDAWLHQGTSLRWATERVRSWCGRQER